MELDSQRLQSHLQKVIGGIITAFVAGVIGQAICSISSIRSTYVGSFPLRGAIKLGVAVVIASILGGIFSSLKFIITYYAGRSAKIKSIGEIEPISVNVLGFIYLLVLGNLFLDSFQSLFYRQRWVITLGKGILIFIAALIVNPCSKLRIFRPILGYIAMIVHFFKLKKLRKSFLP